MALAKTAGRAATVPSGDCTPIFDHIAVWAADTEASARFLSQAMGWKRHPTVIRVSDEEKTTGGMIGTFFDAPGLWIELIEPTTPGPGQDILEALGDGALVEINFDLGNEYQLALDQLAARGVEMLSMDGSPLKDGGTINEGVFDGHEILNPGQRIAYFPTSMTGGTTVEYYEVLSDDAGSLLLERDRAWKDETREPATPWIDHVAIVTDDAEGAASFFADYMGMKRHHGRADEGAAKVVLLDAKGADEKTLWLRLVEPAPGSRAAALLAERGPGHIMELGVVVEDFAAFGAHAARLGLTLVDKLGAPLPAGIVPTEAYFRKEDSCGIPVRLIAVSASVSC
jgi:catechol 2,3-dioxygenase-like lactoylglutathione lyase family enzyme